jgi:succinate dehydrogenase / fumarate reductase cytochrome b subunit
MSSVKAVPAIFSTSVGRKIIVAATGLFLCTFLIAHLSGNLLLLAGDGGAKFNAYAEFMGTNPVIRVMEIVMFAGFLGHIVFALGLAMYNNKARPIAYKKSAGGQNASFYSRFMVYSGTITLIFLVLHLWQFFFQHRIIGHPEGETIYDLSVKTFQNPIFSIGYVICMILLSFHLTHGVQSLFQTLGLTVNKKMDSQFRKLAWGFSILICGGFALIPIYFLIQSMA